MFLSFSLRLTSFWAWPGCTYLLKVVDHEEDVGVAHLGLLSFTVHGVFTGRREHFLWNMADMSNETWICWSDLRAAPEPESYLTFLLVDVDVSCIWARADGTRHHVVQLEDRTDFRLSSVNQQPELCFCESVTDLLQDEVQVDALLPVDVGVTEAGQLLGVSPVNLHLHLKHSPHAPSEPAAGQPECRVPGSRIQETSCHSSVMSDGAQRLRGRAAFTLTTSRLN